VDYKVKFFSSSYNSPNWARYQHTSVAIAEGLSVLGIPFCGNLDYWFDHEINDYLIKKDNRSFDANIHIYSSHFLLDHPEEIGKCDWSKINVLLDNEDGFDSPCMDPKYEKFDLILRCHYNKKFESFREKMDWALDKNACYLRQTKPWNFGLSNRIVKYIDKYRAEEIKDKVLCNFRMKHNIRQMGVDVFNPILSSKYEVFNNVTESLDINETDDHKGYWAQTGRRHNEEYYKNINQCRLTYAFGGKVFFDPIGSDPLKSIKQKGQRLRAKLQRNIGWSESVNQFYTMTQYGGWRLFESFLSNTIPIQIDFEYWNLVWPQNPVAGEHYWSVKHFDFEKSAKDLLNLNVKEIQEISDKGRDWVLEYYTPKAQAERFLKHIETLDK
jgi:hypothetical protein